MAKQTSRQSVPRSEFRPRLVKAKARLEGTDRELAAGAADPAAVLAVQAAVAACDAFTIHHLGKKSSSSRHEDALALLSEVQPMKGLDEARRHLAQLLKMKSAIEYGSDALRLEEAEAIAKHARRFIEFVESRLP